MKKRNRLTEGMAIVLEYLQGQPNGQAASTISEAVGIHEQAVHGMAGGLVKRGLVEKGDKVKMSIINKHGLKEERLYVTYRVTNKGLDYIPE